MVISPTIPEYVRMEKWHDLFVATAGASAALTGLLFVGVSINLTKILSFPTLPSRAFISLVLLMTIMIISIITLIPSESIHIAGTCILIIGATAWLGVLVKDIKILQKTQKKYKISYLFNFSFNQIALLPYFFSGIIMMQGNFSGIYWVIVAVIFSFLKASLDAWVLLIEINR
jgi:hypothetical protein